MNVNQIVRIIPTLKVNNRKLNETFYMETLGMKVLLEESAFLSLGDQTGLEKLVLEEAPSMRTRKVEGRKKLARLIIKVENPLEVEGLLSKTDSIHQLYKGQNGYAFEIFSPEDELLELDLLEQPTNTRVKAANTASNLNSLFIKIYPPLFRNNYGLLNYNTKLIKNQ